MNKNKTTFIVWALAALLFIIPVSIPFLTESDAYRYVASRRRTTYLCKAVTFDGTNDYCLRGAELTGCADGKVGLLSVWLKFDTDGVSPLIFTNALQYFYVTRGAGDNKIYIVGETTAGADTLNIQTSAILSADGWTHIMASWNLAAAVSHLYVDGASDNTEVTNNNNNIDYTRGDWAIGAKEGGTNKFDGDIAELYFALEYLDLSVLTNRQKFIRSGKPAFLGTTGKLPTNSVPIVYQRVIGGDAATAFATNRGTGGNFAITGALAVAATSPSD